MRSNTSLGQAKSIVNAYILPYFIYCPLVWMFCRKKDNTLINKVHKRALRAIHGIFYLNLVDLLSLEKVSIHVKHLQILMTETFKSLQHSNPELMNNLFQLKDRPYNLRNQMLLQIPAVKTITYDTNSIIFKASLLWNSLPNEYQKIKQWSGNSCRCLLCR